MRVREQNMLISVLDFCLPLESGLQLPLSWHVGPFKMLPQEAYVFSVGARAPLLCLPSAPLCSFSFLQQTLSPLPDSPQHLFAVSSCGAPNSISFAL